MKALALLARSVVGTKIHYLVFAFLISLFPSMTLKSCGSWEDILQAQLWHVHPIIVDLVLISTTIVLQIGSINACKKAALKCDELKFEQYKLMAQVQTTDDILQQMQNCLEKIKVLEH